MQIIPISKATVEQLLPLFKSAYVEESLGGSDLPSFSDVEPLTKQSLSRLIEKGSGLAVEEDGELCGYMIGVPVDGLFGSEPGIVVLLHAHAAKVGMKEIVYSVLYEQLAQIWTSQGRTSHAVVLFAHDQITNDFFYENGFGKRCVDAITRVKNDTFSVSNIEIHEATNETIPLIAPLHLEHVRYYRQAPIFMPNGDIDPIKDLTQWVAQKNHHLWYATLNHEVVGYMRIQPTGETVISRSQNMMNITGAYVDPKYRGQHISKALLYEVHRYLAQNGYEYLGVDYESINPQGNRFWSLHFTPYTFSLTRRIDERILPFLQEKSEQ